MIPLLTYHDRTGIRVNLDVLVRSRLLIQANSGGGKSWALRQLLEETFGRVQHIVFDPEGEYATLREKFDYVLGAKHGGDVEATPRTAKVLCRRLMETSASAVLDLYDLKVPERRDFVRLFLTELLALPKDLRRPLLVVLDEAHVFAPEGAKSEALEAVVSLASQGRKRGYAIVCATQRLSKLSKDVAAELNTKLIGRTGLDLDVKRAGDELGMDKEGRARLPHLEPGTFYAFGPALPPGPPILVRTGAVKTSHPEPGALEAPIPEPSAKVKALVAKSLADLPQQATEEARTVDALRTQVVQLTRQLGHAHLNNKVIEKLVPDPKAIERAVAPYRKCVAELQKLAGKAHDAAKIVVNTLAILPAPQIDTGPSPTAERQSPAYVEAQERMRKVYTKPLEHDSDLTGPEQKILNALAWLESVGNAQPETAAAAFVAGYTVGGGAFNNPRGALRSKGFVEYLSGDRMTLTDDGRALAEAPAGDLTTDELQQRILRRLPGPERKILEVLIAAYPEDLSNENCASAAGYSNGGGAFNNPRGRLRTLGLIEYPKPGYMVARPVLFLE